jgi:hypothetical protein
VGATGQPQRTTELRVLSVWCHAEEHARWTASSAAVRGRGAALACPLSRALGGGLALAAVALADVRAAARVRHVPQEGRARLAARLRLTAAARRELGGGGGALPPLGGACVRRVLEVRGARGAAPGRHWPRAHLFQAADGRLGR